MTRFPTLSARAALCAGIALLAGSMTCAPVQAAGGIKAAYVESVIPSHTFSGRITALNAPVSLGPGSGVLGVSSMTLTNFDSGPQQVFIFAPTFNGGNCGSPVIGGSDPTMQVIVQGYSTLHLTFPTALVFSPINGITCVAAEVTTLLHGGSVEFDVNGVVN